GDAGHAYVTGITTGGDFPTTPDTFHTSLSSAGQNAFMTKLRVDGGGLVYSTYLAGNGPGDFGYAIAVGPDGDAYVTGRSGGGLPATAGAPQGTEKGSTDAFIARLDVPTGIDPTTTTTTTTPGTTTTIFSTTSVPTTTLAGRTTTSTTLACRSARCTLEELPQSPACVGQSIPATVSAKLAQTAALLDQAASADAKHARKLLKRAKKALKAASAKAARAAKGKHPQISPACANALRSGVAGVISRLGT